MKDAGFNGAGTREVGVRHVWGGHQGAKAQSLPAQGVVTDIINVSDT